MTKQRKIPIGKSSFETVGQTYYYVDKTQFIVDLLTDGPEVALITRPRRFGKSLMMSTLQSFFELSYDKDGNPVDKAPLFEGLAVSNAHPDVLKHMGAYPVISLSFASVSNTNYDKLIDEFTLVLLREFDRVFKKFELDTNDKLKGRFSYFRNINNINITLANIKALILDLSTALFAATGKKVVILLDEYDVPINSAFVKSVKSSRNTQDNTQDVTHDFDEVIILMKSFMTQTFKDNDALQIGVITGAVQVAKGGLYTGMNNLRVYNMLKRRHSTAFGFTQQEVEELLAYYGLSEQLPIVEDWYDGYRFGRVNPTKIYNPWSVLSYVANYLEEELVTPSNYWVETSGNTLISTLIADSDRFDLRNDVKTLLLGDVVNKRIRETFSFAQMEHNKETVWDLLLAAGYLTPASFSNINGKLFADLKIVNEEVRSVFEESIETWLQSFSKPFPDAVDFEQYLLNRDSESAQEYLQNRLTANFSYNDRYLEQIYHTYLHGILSGLGCITESNMELGEGRPDIVHYPKEQDKLQGKVVIIIECKVARSRDALPDIALLALNQIKDRRYDQGALAQGCGQVISVGIAFYQKQASVVIA